MRRIEAFERATAAYKALSVPEQIAFGNWLEGYQDAQKPAKMFPEKRSPGRPAGSTKRVTIVAAAPSLPITTYEGHS